MWRPVSRGSLVISSCKSSAIVMTKVGWSVELIAYAGPFRPWCFCLNCMESWKLHSSMDVWEVRPKGWLRSWLTIYDGCLFQLCYCRHQANLSEMPPVQRTPQSARLSRAPPPRPPTVLVPSPAPDRRTRIITPAVVTLLCLFGLYRLLWPSSGTTTMQIKTYHDAKVNVLVNPVVPPSVPVPDIRMELMEEEQSDEKVNYPMKVDVIYRQVV